VVTNLISNGIKFTPSGGRVDVRLKTGAGTAELTVSDTGEGIPPEFLSAIFERFRQADGSISRRHGGLGLGLSIARQIIEMHGGTITAHSDGVGLGARFRVTLPLAHLAEPIVLDGDPWTGTPLTGLRILVVDDEADARELLRRLLDEQGCTVTCAASAGEALAILEGTACDVMLTDIGMPVTDGYELLRRVRSADGPRMTAIAVTAFARAEDRDRALAAGFDGHVAKPVNPTHLLQMLGRATAPTVRPPS
jgi:CheY-like chemotaxis protein